MSLLPSDAPLALLAAVQTGQSYESGGARVWAEIRAFMADFTEWADRNLVAVAIGIVVIGFLYAFVFGRIPKR